MLQLFRALMRKDKPIEAADASSVAAVHVGVTDNTWQCILEYEKLHAKSCPQGPSLARFQGMDGIYSFKAQLMMRLWGLRPFDRHPDVARLLVGEYDDPVLLAEVRRQRELGVRPAVE